MTLLACDDSSVDSTDRADGGRDAVTQDGAVGDLDAGVRLDAGGRDAAPADDSGALAADSGDVVDAAPSPSDAGPDGQVDAAVCPTVLLAGGSDVVAQGWSPMMQGPGAITYGSDHVQLATSTLTGARVSGQLLLTYPGALPTDAPFKLQVVMQVESVNAHNPLDSAAAILSSLQGPAGTASERAAMIYLDSDRIGWSDDTQSAAVAVIDGAYHSYELSVDAQRVAHVARDGVELLSRANFTTNGTLAIGDQTNDQNVDAVVRIRSVSRSCL